MSAAWRLVCDAGGTNVRFARAFGNELHACRSYLVSRFDTYWSALDAYLAETGGADSCAEAVVGAAGPVEQGAVKLTNAPWVIDANEVQVRIGQRCRLINDLEAAAFCIPGLKDGEYIPLGSVSPDLSIAKRVLAANLGTGFGAAALLASPRWISCPSEAGHMSLSMLGECADGLAVSFPTVESLLSGNGLAALHRSLNPSSDAAAETLFADASSDAGCARTLDIFSRILGNVLGNLTLAVAAWDGVFLFGSVAASFSSAADARLLRDAFENKDKMRTRMKQVPLVMVTKQDAALAGLAAVSFNDA